MHLAAAATDVMNENNKRILDKIAAVNSIINSYDTTEPPYCFKISYGDETVKQTKQVGMATMSCALVLFIRSFRPSASMRMAGIVIAAAAVIFAIICLVYAVNLQKADVAEINGDSITIKGRMYNYSDISEINGAAMNNLKVMSGGRKVISLNKSWDGCGDLVRWARLHNIPINDHSENSSDELQKKNQTLAAVITVGCVFVAILIVVIKRMVM